MRATPIDLQAEYDNRGKVAGSAAILDGWVRDAALFRAACPHAEYDLAYGPTARQALDIFWPDPARAASIALFIHGGYWQSLDKSWVSHFARGLLRHGIAVAIPSHDLCPSVPMAEIVRQLRSAAGFLATRHRAGVFSFGHSAGGHLTAMLLATDWPARGLPADTITGGTSISGLFDLPPLIHTSVNAKLQLDAGEAARLSPIRMPRPSRRFRAIVGALEGPEYIRQTVEMADHWHAPRAILRDHHHFSIMNPLTDPADLMVTELAGDIRRNAGS